MQIFSYQHFRLCVFAFDAAHVIAALCYGMYIGHGIKVRRREGTRHKKENPMSKKQRTRKDPNNQKTRAQGTRKKRKAQDPKDKIKQIQGDGCSR